MAENRSGEPSHELSISAARSRLVECTRHKKRALLVGFDFITVAGVLWVLMSLRYRTLYVPPDLKTAFVLLAAPALVVTIFAYANLYRLVTRYIGAEGYTRIVASVGLATLIWALIIFMSGAGMPRVVVGMFGVIAAATIVLMRHLIGWALRAHYDDTAAIPADTERVPVIIYGAGPPGLQLAQALGRASDRDVVGFCDSSPTLWGQYLGGKRVYQPFKLQQAVAREGVKEILLALPASERHRRREALKELEGLPVTVKIMPALEDLASGHIGVTDLRDVDVGDLLGRDSVPPIPDLLARNTQGRNVLVTGAGGSVGSELARQVSKHGPARLVLLDVSEAALYLIDTELRDLLATWPVEQARPEIIPVIGSVLNAALVGDTLARYQIETIYHAAAYKHVPLVEMNPFIGLENNVFGTQTVAAAAVEHGVARMVLISTDKAVHPTNVMGASKRLSELVLQAMATQKPATVFTMVRFGNVLDSSGSVVARFRNQIKAGGPVTVTHPEIIRYFMSIPEAAELVIQAGAMGRGGDLFVLDMSEPVKIDELARLMIRLSGRQVKDARNPDGDIEIVYTGLRPGDKLYEELLIGTNTSSTEHSQILRSHEPALAQSELERELAVLRQAISSHDLATLQAVLTRTVEGYRPTTDMETLGQTAASRWVQASRTLH